MMSAPSYSRSFITIAHGFKRLQISDPLTHCLAPALTRCYATHTQLPADTTPHPPSPPSIPVDKKASPSSLVKTQAPVVATHYVWPSFEPKSIHSYRAEHLNLPLRKDILHRAVIYEGDNTRAGTASAKHRTAVHGSNRKVRPQKGTGMARLSNRKSPSIRGGGVAHGPQPRDFSTDLPRKVYDLAWRTALSHRYKKGELLVLQNKVTMEESQGPGFLESLFERHEWGQGNGRSLVVVEDVSDEVSQHFEAVGKHAELATVYDVDVKDLLSCGRVIIEREALRHILFHPSDLGK